MEEGWGQRTMLDREALTKAPSTWTLAGSFDLSLGLSLRLSLAVYRRLAVKAIGLAGPDSGAKRNARWFYPIIIA